MTSFHVFLVRADPFSPDSANPCFRIDAGDVVPVLIWPVVLSFVQDPALGDLVWCHLSRCPHLGAGERWAPQGALPGHCTLSSQRKSRALLGLSFVISMWGFGVTLENKCCCGNPVGEWMRSAWWSLWAGFGPWGCFQGQGQCKVQGCEQESGKCQA